MLSILGACCVKLETKHIKYLSTIKYPKVLSDVQMHNLYRL